MTRFDLIFQQLQEAWLILALAAVVIVILGRRGVLDRRNLLAGPSRAIGLGPADLLIGFGLMVVGMGMVPLVIGGAAPPDSDAGAPVEAPLRSQLAMVLVGQLFIQVPPMAYLAWRAARAGALKRVGLVSRRPMRDLGVGTLAVLATLPVVGAVLVLTTIVGLLIDRPAPVLSHGLLPAFQEPGQLWAKAGLVVAVAVIAPIAEECVYRGLLQSCLVEMLGRRRRWAALLIASGLFACIHLGAVTWHALPALFVLAVILGWLYERTGSLWPPILVHAGFNAFNVAMVLFVVPSPS